jgi:hypothetical protein
MLYMVFIIFQLARESKAGKFGTFVLFLALGLGLVGFRGQVGDQVLHGGRGIAQHASAGTRVHPAWLHPPGQRACMPAGVMQANASAQALAFVRHQPMCRPPLHG